MENITVNVVETVAAIAVSVTETPQAVAVSVAEGLPEAPIDGKQYARKNAAWAEVVGGGGGSSGISFLPDPGPTVAPGETVLWVKPSAGSFSLIVREG